MSIIETSFSEFFAGATLVLDNAQTHPEIADALATVGYDAETLQEGQALLETARDLYDAQIREYGEQHAATQAFIDASKQADKIYSAHRRLAKLAFKNDPQRQTDLHLNERKPQTFTPWYNQARHFYTALLSDADAQSAMSRFNVTLESIQAGANQVEQALSLKEQQEQEKGEAQQATKDRDEAIRALDEWLSDFRVVARIALADSPQLLEALNLGAIP